MCLQVGRQGPRIGQQVVHRLHTCGGEIAQPADLDRRRLPGKDRQPVVRGMPSQVDQDVNPVRMNLPGQGLIGESGNLTPAAATGPQPHGQRVASGGLAVDLQVHAPSGPVGQFL